MPTTDSLLAQLGANANDSDYLIRNPTEILFILRGLLQKNTLLALNFRPPGEFILTSLLDIYDEDDQIVLDYGGDPRLCQRALEEDRMICATAHEQIKVQFACTGLQKTLYDGKTAFSAALPDALLRIQRRESFRITTPQINPLKCAITLPGNAPTFVEVTLADISCGGMAITDFDSVLELETGQTFPRCRLVLPNAGTISFAMCIRGVFTYTLKNGQMRKRAGCEFIDMSDNVMALVQRYITALERGRNARLKGLS